MPGPKLFREGPSGTPSPTAGAWCRPTASTNGGPLAGLWQEGAPGQPPRFLVLTTTPNALVAPIHDRMPAVLSREEAGAWLAQPGPELLHPAPDDALEATPVSPRVNSVKNDDPACLVPAPPGETGADQLPLFVR